MKRYMYVNTSLKKKSTCKQMRVSIPRREGSMRTKLGLTKRVEKGTDSFNVKMRNGTLVGVNLRSWHFKNFSFLNVTSTCILNLCIAELFWVNEFEWDGIPPPHPPCKKAGYIPVHYTLAWSSDRLHLHSTTILWALRCHGWPIVKVPLWSKS